METTQLNNKKSSGFQARFQKIGGYLSRMVIPNIGAFIAFGLITAIFLETGWYPNETIIKLKDPLLRSLLPILIGYSGGELVYGKRGAVAGALATFGLTIGSDVAMFLGAMIVGPFGGWIIKKFDQAIDGKVREGFEMIVDNFSLGIIGGIFCILSFLFVEPIMAGITNALASGVVWVMEHKLLPLSAIFIEPARVLFLNNVIDHGILAPIGLEQVASQGFSPLFMIIPNPGIGLGILLAYWFFGKGEMKEAVPGAVIIHFLGGIHEIFFPYVLANPLLILADIAGGIAAIITMQITNYGPVYTPSPGSIISVLALTPRGKYLGAILTVGVSCLVTFLVASIFVKKYYRGYVENSPGSNTDGLVRSFNNIENNGTIDGQIKKIVVACDAGMGSSAMSASSLKKKLKEAGYNIEVVHTALQNIPNDADIVVTHKELTNLAMKAKPEKYHMSISSYINPPEFADVVNVVRENNDKDMKVSNSEKITSYEPSKENKTPNSASNEVLKLDNIIITDDIKNRDEALRLINKHFVDGGYTTEKYLEAMVKKEKEFNTNIGNGLAIPHGTFEYKDEILKTGLVILVCKNGVRWNDEDVKLIIGIAGKGDEHLEILSKLATEFETQEKVDEFIALNNKTKMKNILESDEN
ncbi:PTS mannitol transporter subunit IICBA [Anaerococcus sp. mt242]|uniref:PTS mannitol transporter subunit IICBA n=1 Tax=Anaerococcus sp. mt242 TaxID=2661917 RepID=UPI001932ABCE|nr:PTS mannitol transporter subunit IICBA [Anaerococcus sp. mt242]MBM0047103.1 PTS mannitol transporter subunit IICBA [Anaerococcus sp. mt242]